MSCWTFLPLDSRACSFDLILLCTFTTLEPGPLRFSVFFGGRDIIQLFDNYRQPLSLSLTTFLSSPHHTILYPLEDCFCHPSFNCFSAMM